jgi:SAM-dependent methyltransferase
MWRTKRFSSVSGEIGRAVREVCANKNTKVSIDWSRHRLPTSGRVTQHTYSCRRALDIGCAVGGAAFELARTFDEVVGIDFSHAFIAAANDMKTNRSRTYKMVIEGTIMEDRVAEVPSGVDTTRVHFQQVCLGSCIMRYSQ